MYGRKTIDNVCKECEEKTKIVYLYKDGFFKPKLKGINHLEVGSSSMISNPFTILFEFFYLIFGKIRNYLHKISRWLFPRRQKIFGTAKDTSVVGRITFARKNDVKIPLHHVKCEIWTRTKWYTWRKLGNGITDRDGNISIAFDLRASRRWGNRSIRFEIYQTTHIYYKDDTAHAHNSLFRTIMFSKKDMIGLRYNLHDVQLFYWEYRDDTTVPRVVIKDHDRDAPEYYAQGRLDSFYKQVIPIEFTKIKHLDQIKLAPETITLETLNEDYPENLTRCIEKKLPGYTRSDQWMGERMMNGMNRGFFEPEKGNSTYFWIKYYGVCNYPHNDEYALPTSRVRFQVEKNEFPVPVEIRLTGPLNAFNKDPWQERIIKPEDGDIWEYAKRVVRVNGAFTTELDEHFTGTHLNAEQFAIAAYRNLRLSPISTLLLPHLKEVSLVNHSADKILLKGFIPQATALTFEGLEKRTRDILGIQDWKNWEPMKPLNDKHTCARAESLFWDILTKYVDEFVDNNIEEIKKYWFEIYRFSEDLVNNSVPVFNSDVDLNTLDPEEKELAMERMRYNSLQYGFDTTVKRETRNGELKALSPITLKPDFDEKNAKEEIRNLKHACSYMIMIATYMHTWINEHQYDQLGEVLYSCGGLRFGEKEEGILAPESDLSISPDLSVATKGLWLANILSRTEYGFITTNNENDINQDFIDRLLEKEEEFKSYKVNIREVESRTNI